MQPACRLSFSLDGVAATFEASPDSPVVSGQRLLRLLLRLLLLLLLPLRLAPLPGAPGNHANRRAGGGPLARVVVSDLPDDCAGCGPSSRAPHTLALRPGRRGLACCLLRQDRRIHAGGLRRPGVALPHVFLLLLGGLAFGRIDDRLLRPYDRSHAKPAA